MGQVSSLRGTKAFTGYGKACCKSWYNRTFSVLIQDLFAYIQTLSGKLTEAEYDLRDKKDVIKLTRDRAEDAEKQVQAFQNEKVEGLCHSFTLRRADSSRLDTPSFPY
jgi:hypothetical protein